MERLISSAIKTFYFISSCLFALSAEKSNSNLVSNCSIAGRISESRIFLILVIIFLSGEINDISERNLEPASVIGTISGITHINKSMKALKTFTWIAVVSFIVMFSSCVACTIQ